MKTIQNYIHGEIISESANSLPVYDPSTGEIISNVCLSGIDDFNNVIESSKKSQIDWAKTTPLKRSRIISKYKNLIEENIQELAELVSTEHGKTLGRC